ncbi:hypothetical protein H2200_002864 [Cladophialophora chaetospira]|uniref:Uncharacterized protein n=1 Tax=Cladophialophora chaetospira TaxID=386627 RepID=A0AA38XG94_9EURO|nr:hypothetical protein H2200_002864 [Cladophialophora chaetospira]
MQQLKNTSASRRRTTPSKSPQPEIMQGKRPSVDLPGTRKSKTPSQTFMFVPMSSEPGKRARIQPGLRASAKAHVMHDYQRKTAEKRLGEWKMSTPKTFSLAPREPSLDAPVVELSTRPRQEVVGWETVVFQKAEDPSESDVKTSLSENLSSEMTRHSSKQTSTPSSSQNSFATRLSQQMMPTIPSQPRSGYSLDIFGVLPIQAQPWDETLITRWLNYDRIPWCPVNGQSQWIPFVAMSPVLLHTNLYCWGMHWHGKLTGIEQQIFLYQNPRILEHKISAIQMVNSYLESRTTVPDEVLAAVAIFINVSLQFFNREEAISHMAGLETLVRLRGGLESLSGMGTVGVLLQRMISWNDLFFVELFGGNLRFSLLPRWDEAWQTVYEPLLDDPVTHLEPLQARFAGNLGQEITTILREIQVVCNDIQARPFETLNTEDKTLRHDLLFRFERRLCLATRITTVQTYFDPQNRSHDTVWRAVAYAALMFVHHHMRPGYELHWAQFRALTVQLRGELSSLTTSSWDAVPALHLWVLSVGSWVSQREVWILNMLAEACRARGCVTWDAYERVLDDCPSLGVADQEKFRIVWSDVARLL